MPELWEATANGEITATDENCTERGFVYGKTAQSAPGDTAPANTGYTDSVSESGSFGAGTFSLSLPGLDASECLIYSPQVVSSQWLNTGRILPTIH